MATEPVVDVVAQPADSPPAAVNNQPVGDVDLTPPSDQTPEAKGRWAKLTDSNKSLKQRVEAYEALGSPEEIVALKEKVGQIDTLQAQIAELNADRRRGEPKSAEQVTAETALKQAKQELRQIDSGIERGEKAAEYVEAQIESVYEDALEYTKEVLKKHGLPTDKESVAKWSRRFAGEINGVPRLQRMLFRNPEKAIDIASEALLGEVGAVTTRKADADRQREKEKLTGLPKPHGGAGGQGAQTGPTQPKSLREAMDGFRAALKEQNARGG